MRDDVVIFIRPDQPGEPSLVEDAAAREFFPVVNTLDQVPAGRLVVGRYALQPFYAEVERELGQRGSWLLNSYEQHRFASDLGLWSEALGDQTFPTWSDLGEVPAGQPLVVKGETNSRKHDWEGSFYAPDREAAAHIAARLEEDPLLAGQQLYFRAYTPLRELLPSTGGRLPIVEEYRFFVLAGRVLASGFYWGWFQESLVKRGERLDPALVPAEFLEQAIGKIGSHCAFYTIDVARTAAGDWVVVDLNDGSASGLASIPPRDFYRALRAALS